MRVTYIAAGSSGGVAQYGPTLIAVGSLIMALVAAVSRRDRKEADSGNALTAKTNTALTGLTEAYDRVEQERSRQEQRANDAIRERDAALVRAAAAEAQVALLRDQLSRMVQPRKRAAPRAARKKASGD